MKKLNLALAASAVLTLSLQADDPAPTNVAHYDRVPTPIFGIVRVTGAQSAASAVAAQHAGEVVVSTPWVGPAGEEITVKDLITNGLTEGDMLFVYDMTADSERYHAFEWDGGKWVGAKDAKDPLQLDAVDSAACVVKAGVSVWYSRKSHDNLFSITGQVREPVETTVTASKKTLVVNPFWAEADLLEKLEATGAAEGDILVVDKVRYTYETVGDVSGWYKVIPGETSKRTVGGKEIIYRKPDTKEKVSSIAVAAGTEIWYDSNGGAPKIVWKTAPEESGSEE